MKRIGIFFAFIFGISHVLVNAQENNFNDYILTSETDTVFGIVRQTLAFQPINYCGFAPKGTLNETRYKPSDLYGYGLANGKQFYSKSVTIGDKDTLVFVEKLFDGTIDLYGFRLNSADRFYIERDTLHILLIGEEIIRYEAKPHEMFTGGNYASKIRCVGQLKLLMYDSPKMQKELGKLVTNKAFTFNKKRLIKLFNEYESSRVKGTSFVFNAKKEFKNVFTFSVLRGSSLNRLKFKSTDGYWSYLSNAEVTKNLAPITGLSVSANVSRSSNFLYFTIEGFHTKLMNIYEYSNQLFESKVDLSFNIIGSRLKAEYAFNYNKIELIPGFGLWYCNIKQFETNTIISVENIRNPVELKGFTYGFVSSFRFNYNFNKYIAANFNINYDFNVYDMDSFALLKTKLSLFSLNIGVSASIGKDYIK